MSERRPVCGQFIVVDWTLHSPSQAVSSGPKIVALQTNRLSSLWGLALHPCRGESSFGHGWSAGRSRRAMGQSGDGTLGSFLALPRQERGLCGRGALPPRATKRARRWARGGWKLTSGGSVLMALRSDCSLSTAAVCWHDAPAIAPSPELAHSCGFGVDFCSTMGGSARVSRRSGVERGRSSVSRYDECAGERSAGRALT
jgi:hypothetical protein